MRKFYPGITLFKLAGSLLVLTAHVMLFRYVALMPGQAVIQFTSLATRVVVPCFYVVAGFLAYKSWCHAENPHAYMLQYLKRIGMIYSLFCCIFIATFIIPKLVSDGFTAANLFIQAKVLVIAFFLNGPFIQFWFIPPLVFGLLAAYWLIRKQYIRLAVSLALAGFVIMQFVSGSLKTVLGISAESFSSIDSAYIEYLYLFATRYIGFGLTFVIAGVLIAKYEEWFLQLQIKRLLLFAFILTTMETLLLLQLSEWTTDYKLAFSMLPNTLIIFYGILHIQSQTVHKFNKAIGLFSVVMFFGHILFMQANMRLFGWSAMSMSVLADFLLLLLTIAECVAVTIFIRIGARLRDARHTRQASAL
ncbi:acyltransferase family protein [Paenibacillus sinopodophylli]|uniref:acyltransferase family protein n=1 Tax=Paenibacillus sinopodophylli TaxID=1837342 RepID=UPI00110CBD80|nr:acyltransferase family protein [Paenibacillus sinopodophylli]